jgi:hypothetical protein
VVRTLLCFLAVVSTLLLLLSLPSGSIDVSDLWRFLGFASLPLFLVLGFYLLRRTQSARKRTASRLAISSLLLPAGLLFLLLCVAEVGCTKRAAPSYSPDGKHVAILRFALQGALGDDYANQFRCFQARTLQWHQHLNLSCRELAVAGSPLAFRSSA